MCWMIYAGDGVIHTCAELAAEIGAENVIGHDGEAIGAADHCLCPCDVVASCERAGRMVEAADFSAGDYVLGERD